MNNAPETADGGHGSETVDVSPGRDLLVGTISAVGGLLVVWYSLGLRPAPGGGPGSGLVPGIVGGMAAVVGVTLVLLALLRLRRERANGRARSASGAGQAETLLRHPGSLDVLAVLGAIAFYIAFVEILGFLITMAVVQFGLMAKFKRNLISALAISVVSTVVLYFVFKKLLYVPLQDGVFLGPIL